MIKHLTDGKTYNKKTGCKLYSCGSNSRIQSGEKYKIIKNSSNKTLGNYSKETYCSFQTDLSMISNMAFFMHKPLVGDEVTKATVTKGKRWSLIMKLKETAGT